jgi:hypothetical protein
MHPPLPRTALHLCGIGLLWSLPLAADAVETSARLSIRLSEEYNDNIRLVANPKRRVWVTSVTPIAQLSARTETLSATAKAQVSVNRYSGDASLNNTDILLDAALKKRFERDKINLGASYVRDSTRASELTQTGVVQANRERRRFGLTPSWSALATERATWSVGYDYADVQYKDAEGTGLTDYRSGTAYTKFDYRFSERATSFVEGGLTRLKIDATRNDVRARYALAGLQYSFTELLKTEFSAGARRVDFSSSNGDSKNGWLTRLNVERTLETGSIRLGAARELNPTGSGELTQTDKLFAEWSGKLSAQWRYGLSGSAYRNSRVSSATDNARARYYRVDANLAWAFTETWTFEVGLAHARQEPEGGETAKANSIFLGIRYDIPLPSDSP